MEEAQIKVVDAIGELLDEGILGESNFRKPIPSPNPVSGQNLIPDDIGAGFDDISFRCYG
jgi:hypothetical protein